MRALQYFFKEALASLWRARGAALLAVATIALGLFVLGFFLLLNANVQQLVERWSESAELSVFLEAGATSEELKAIDELVAQSGLTIKREYVSKEQALARFRNDFPDLAPAAASLGSNPLPASFELRLRPDAREVSGVVDGLVATLSMMDGVEDVRYDRQWLARLNAVVRGARVVGGVLVAMLALAAAMTVANVVRLGAAARRDEIEIMQLVGAPLAYVRGPFVAEGILQGGAGAILAIGALAGAYLFLRSRFGEVMAAALGTSGLTFLSLPLLVVLLMGGMALGYLGGYVVARRVT
jgi:cell division transport system permease protein